MGNPVKSRPGVLIADGQEVTLNGLMHILKRNSYQVSEARTINDLRRHLKITAPDLLIVDYQSLKDFSSDELIALRQQNDLPLMVVTSHRDKKTILRILECGVHGFLFKDCTELELIRCVRALLRGERFFCNDVFDILMEARLARPGGSWPSQLTTREVDIIRLIVKGYSTSVIASELNLSPHTISTHRKNIIRKLKVKSPIELVTHAYDLGLILRDEV